ncbi:U-box domain-containing protein 35 [Beta vulgaris subsp. vulgaris]|uniref:U-box domain-containing protein 35 n=1 Tax=Beta vulgaris subsp. vulgaris TaxID=3555 RepID=UPI0020372FD5|nr:U-box domain-containing protein 35 [Beta vulgaris subsp. vulgaris]
MFLQLISMINMFIKEIIFCRRSLSLMRADDLCQVISENAPSICSVYTIGDGKLQQLRPASSEQNVITMDDTSHLLKNKPTSPRYGSTAAASDFSTSTSEPKHPEFSLKHTARTKTLVRETLERRQYTFKDLNIKFGNASTQSQSSSSGDSGSWVSDRTSPGCSLIGTQTDVPSPIGTLHNGGAFAATSTTVCFMNTPPAGTPPMSSYMATHPAGSRAGTPPGGSYVGTSARTPPQGSDVGTPPYSYDITPPSVSFLNIPSDSKRGSSSNQIAELEKLRIELRHIEKICELTHNSFFS